MRPPLLRTQCARRGGLGKVADALKLVLKETIIPAQANKALFYLAPVMTLIFSLLGWDLTLA